MELLRTIEWAHDLTRRLHEALENQDLELCGDLLEQRGQAMEGFARAHHMASIQERKSCQPQIEMLTKVDEKVQERSQELLALVAKEFRGNLGKSHQAHHQTKGQPTQACLDKKA